MVKVVNGLFDGNLETWLDQKGNCNPNWLAFIWIGLKIIQLFDIRGLLLETHVMDYGLAFERGRWSLKD